MLVEEFEIADGVLKRYNGDGGRVVIPYGVVRIGYGAFEYCSRECTEVVIPESVVSIDWRAFAGACVVRVEIPDSVKEIGREAFFLCAQLEELMIPDSVNVIGRLAFANCHFLRRCNIPKGLTHLSESTFWGCDSLAEIEIPEGVTEIGSCVFAHCASLKEVILPSTVESVGTEAFMNCRGLRRVVTGAGLKRIERKAFSNCRALSDVVLRDGLTDIGEFAFNRCASLDEMIIPDSVAQIGAHAFDEASPTARLYISYGFRKILDTKNGKNAWAAALRGALRRLLDGQLTAENDGWAEYIDRNGTRLMELLGEYPPLYLYLARRGLINSEEVSCLLENTVSAECRAILLEYSRRFNGDDFFSI